MLLVVGGIKGGSGKTTLATNLALLRAAEVESVLLVDADEQKSTSAWAEQREALKIPCEWTTIQLNGSNTYLQLARLKERYKDIVVDVGGRDTTTQRSALSVADAFLVPFKPRTYDIWTLPQVILLISEVMAKNPELKTLAVLNQCDANGKDNQQAECILRECPIIETIPHTIGSRKAFSSASAFGLGVGELKDRDKKAFQEIKKIYEYIYMRYTQKR